MSGDMNMDASSAQENCETGQSSRPRQTTSIQEHEFGSRSLTTGATEEKHMINTESVNKESTEARAAECDHNGNEQLKPLHEDLSINSSCEQLGHQLEDATMNSNSEQLGLLPEDAARENLSGKQAMSELNRELVPESGNSEALVEKQKVATEYVQNGPAEIGTVELDHLGLEQSGLPFEDVTKNSGWEQLKSSPEDERKSSLELLGLPPEDLAVDTSLEQLKALPNNVFKNCDLKQLEAPPEDAANNPSMSEGRSKRTYTKSTKGKHAPSTRVLRSRSQEKSKAPEPSNTPEQSNNLVEHGDGANGEQRRKKKKKKQKRMKKIEVDEFSRIRTHLRYLINRMNYEQNLIHAYSGEGWKGQSLEKIKPEKELQRAKSEIFRRKLKIRDLFQRLDLSIAEGRLPESLFDSEGQIDSEDIFCAKCRSKDLSPDNDIILCDGACERGFHQFCLEPPLLKEDIPPADEGWLCPGCDCKVDCIDLLNDSQGTNISVRDTWEKVFPEAAAAAAAGNKLDDSLGLPSDDSEDNDYDPDDSELDEKIEEDESSSDNSDFYSASEDDGAPPKNKQNLELPSDDSEDDDYNPTAPDLDDQVKQESSSSDFTSDSEDFSVAFDDKRSPRTDEPMPVSSDHTKPCRGSDGERSKVGQRKNQSLNDELLSLLESGPGQGESASVSRKRHVERLDYKKLYDETYEKVSSDSSDEDWMDAADAPKRRKNNTVASASPGGSTPIIEGTNAKDMKHNQEESEHTPKRGARKKLDGEGTNNSPARSYKGSSQPGSTCSSTKRSAYRRLGEAVTQGLLKSFKENQYPERASKENLAKELGITVHQVSKWFENARWSFRHSSRMESSLVGSVPSKGTPPQMNLSEPGLKMVIEDVCNGVKNKELSEVNAGVTMGNSLTEESTRQRSMNPEGCKRRSQSDHQASDDILTIEEAQKPSAPVDLPKAEGKRKRGRPRSRKSGT